MLSPLSDMVHPAWSAAHGPRRPRDRQTPASRSAGGRRSGPGPRVPAAGHCPQPGQPAATRLKLGHYQRSSLAPETADAGARTRSLAGRVFSFKPLSRLQSMRPRSRILGTRAACGEAWRGFQTIQNELGPSAAASPLSPGARMAHGAHGRPGCPIGTGLAPRILLGKSRRVWHT